MSNVPISVSRLSEFEDTMMSLRQLLRSSFLLETQRKEKKVYEIIVDTVRPQIGLLLDKAATAEDEVRACEAQLSLSRHLQIILSALLLLSPDGNACVDTFSLEGPPASPEEQHAENPSAFYVSASQRAYAMQLLVFLCFSPVFSAQSVISSLYPLLDAGTGKGAIEPTENAIGPELLESGKYQNKKKAISSLLFGVLLSRKSGLLGLMKTFLLNDKVREPFVFDAVRHITRLLTHPVAKAFILQSDERKEETHTQNSICVRFTEVSVEQQMQSICEQLVGLSGEHSTFGETGKDDEAAAEAPSFLRRMREAHPLVPKETLEQRLHLCITLLLNEWVTLPPKTDKRFASAYMRFFLFNKFYLSPAFSALSLRRHHVADPQAEVVLSLHRLCAILHGNGLGCGFSALLCIFEPICPGFLCLFSLFDKVDAATLSVLEQITKLLFDLPVVWQQLGVCLLRGCLSTTAHCFCVENVVERHLIYDNGECTTETRVKGLRELCARAPPDFKRYVVGAVVMEFQGETLLDVKLEETQRTLALFVEDMCLGTSSESLFGTDATLLSTLSLAESVCAVSPLCLQWGASIIAKMINTQFVESYLSHCSEAVSILLSRLQNKCQRLHHSLDQAFQRAIDNGVTTAAAYPGVESASALNIDALCTLRVEVEASIVALQKYLANRQKEVSSVPDDTQLNSEAVLREWETVSKSFEQNVVLKAYTSTMMDLLRLSSSIEENIFLIKCQGRFYPMVQRLLTQLFIILYGTADGCVAVHAIKCIGWLGMYRMDSADSSFLTQMFLTYLMKEDTSKVLVSVNNTGNRRSAESHNAPTTARLTQREESNSVGRVRMLDLLLFWCDHDTDSLTLRKMDDNAKAHHSGTIYYYLSQQCLATADPLLQVASLHCIGQYVVATFPRVTMALVVQLARDVFRLSQFEMAKAAAASMLARVTSLLCAEAGLESLFTDAAFAELKLVGDAMRNYHSPKDQRPLGNREAGAVCDDEVIRMHGQTIGELLQNYPVTILTAQ